MFQPSLMAPPQAQGQQPVFPGGPGLVLTSEGEQQGAKVAAGTSQQSLPQNVHPGHGMEKGYDIPGQQQQQQQQQQPQGKALHSMANQGGYPPPLVTGAQGGAPVPRVAHNALAMFAAFDGISVSPAESPQEPQQQHPQQGSFASFGMMPQQGQNHLPGQAHPGMGTPQQLANQQTRE
ncbi:unnamed protein product [Discosporangium mesarthrocarpum]